MRTAQTSNGKRQRGRDRDRERDRDTFKASSSLRAGKITVIIMLGKDIYRVSRVPSVPQLNVELPQQWFLKGTTTSKRRSTRRSRRREVAARGNCQVRCPTSVVVLDRQRRNAARHTGAYTVICMCCTPFRCHSPSHIRTHTHTTHTHLRTHSSTLDS